MPDEPRTEAQFVDALARTMACDPSPLDALLTLLLEALPDEVDGVSVLTAVRSTGQWIPLASRGAIDAVEALRLTGAVAAFFARDTMTFAVGTAPAAGWDAPLPLSGGSSTLLRLVGSGRLVGAVVVDGCTPAAWSALPPAVRAGLLLCVAGGLSRAAIRFETEFARRSTGAIRRLFEEGANARDVTDAGTVLARVAAEAFQTERAGMYVVDPSTGIIRFAVGVGISGELSDALAASLVGKVAAESPVWQDLERRGGGPAMVDDATVVPARPGGFVETLGFVSYVALPLRSKGGTLGMVICGEASRHRQWTARERELAEQFALEAALVVDAARLRESERAQLALITEQAYHDSLTGIANRRLLMDRLEAALLGTSGRCDAVAVLVLDIDNFKQVNDTLGHRVGDELLCVIAERLTAGVRSGDTVARLGGDEFAIVMNGDLGVESVRAAAARICALLARPVELDGVLLNASASIGIAFHPEHATTATDLLQRADIAMYTAKRSRSGFAVYDAATDHATVDQLRMHGELMLAIARDELELAYQPKLSLDNNVISGVEVLVRWRHPRHGLLAPAAFLPMAESTGLIHRLTAWVVSHALAQWAEWCRAGVVLDLAVNVSARDLLDPTLVEAMADLIRSSGAADHLVLEITETAVMNDPAQSARVLAELRALGARISLDDFGTGYSSLTQLGQLPVDELKIDRTLVVDVDVNPLHCTLVDTLVGLGHRLGLDVVGEGVESAACLGVLRELGCDHAQGYVISRPVPAAELLDVVAASSRSLADL